MPEIVFWGTNSFLTFGAPLRFLLLGQSSVFYFWSRYFFVLNLCSRYSLQNALKFTIFPSLIHPYPSSNSINYANRLTSVPKDGLSKVASRCVTGFAEKVAVFAPLILCRAWPLKPGTHTVVWHPSRGVLRARLWHVSAAREVIHGRISAALSWQPRHAPRPSVYLPLD